MSSANIIGNVISEIALNHLCIILLISNVKRRQAEFLGHVMRKGKLEHLLTTGKIEGKRSRGRQRIKIQEGIAAWLGRSTAEMFVDARDREKWKVMIAYACNRHGN